MTDTVDDDDVVEPGGGRRRFRVPPPTRVQLVALVAALMFLAGSAGYVIGAGRPPGSESVDVGFLEDMSVHHDQAVEMAEIALVKATEPSVRGFARETLISQQYEMGLMSAWLGRWGYSQDPDRATAMRWMGHPTPIDQMAGLASAEQMAALRDAEGRQVDSLFLSMMEEHHRGAVEMASVAARKAGDGAVRDLASAIVRNQAIEIDELRKARRRLGF